MYIWGLLCIYRGYIYTMSAPGYRAVYIEVYAYRAIEMGGLYISTLKKSGTAACPGCLKLCIYSPICIELYI